MNSGTSAICDQLSAAIEDERSDVIGFVVMTKRGAEMGSCLSEFQFAILLHALVAELRMMEEES